MQTNHSSNPSGNSCNMSNAEVAKHEKLHEVLRFAIVGTIATALQYACYLLLNGIFHPTIANTVAYIVSFIFNYIASTRYTFKVKSTAKRGMGFAFSHIVNYTMQTIVLQATLWIGVAKDWAMVPVFAICVPTNFILVRYFLKHK